MCGLYPSCGVYNVIPWAGLWYNTIIPHSGYNTLETHSTPKRQHVESACCLFIINNHGRTSSNIGVYVSSTSPTLATLTTTLVTLTWLSRLLKLECWVSMCEWESANSVPWCKELGISVLCCQTSCGTNRSILSTFCPFLCRFVFRRSVRFRPQFQHDSLKFGPWTWIIHLPMAIYIPYIMETFRKFCGFSNIRESFFCKFLWVWLLERHMPVCACTYMPNNGTSVNNGNGVRIRCVAPSRTCPTTASQTDW